MFFYKLQNFFYNDRILGQASRKIWESVGSISRGPTPGNGNRSISHTLFEVQQIYNVALQQHCLIPLLQFIIGKNPAHHIVGTTKKPNQPKCIYQS